MKVDNRQFKVTQDCMIILDKKPEHAVGKQVHDIKFRLTFKKYY